jgi:hypothetical protein
MGEYPPGDQSPQGEKENAEKEGIRLLAEIMPDQAVINGPSQERTPKATGMWNAAY